MLQTPSFHDSATLDMFWPGGTERKLKMLEDEETRSLESRMKGVKYFSFIKTERWGFICQL